MVNVEVLPSRVVRVEGSEWIKMPEDEFRLLTWFVTNPKTMMSFRDLQLELWGFYDERETPMLALTRMKLIRILKRICPNYNWENVIYRDRFQGYRYAPHNVPAPQK